MENKYAVVCIKGTETTFCTEKGVVLLFDDRAHARAYAVDRALKLKDPTAVRFKPVKYINSPAEL